MPTEGRLRQFILLLLSFGLLAVGAELLVLGHYEDPWQLVPFGLITLSLLTIVWHRVAGGAGSVRALQMIMILLILAGGLGIALHYRGNVEFQLETNPNLAGWQLFAKAVHAKVPPAMAPGVMAQLGLLGLIYAFRHPLRHPARADRSD